MLKTKVCFQAEPWLKNVGEPLGKNLLPDDSNLSSNIICFLNFQTVGLKYHMHFTFLKRKVLEVPEINGILRAKFCTLSVGVSRKEWE